MYVNAISVYVFSAVMLFAKFLATIIVQAAERMRTRSFRYSEDAAFWQGAVAEDSELCSRAQQLLRNDCESQPYYLVFGALYLALGLWPAGAPLYFSVYALSRMAHAYYMFRPLQPHRNRAFAVGVIVLVILSAHLACAGVRYLVLR